MSIRHPIPPVEKHFPPWAQDEADKASTHIDFLEEMEAVCRKHSLLATTDPRWVGRSERILDCKKGKPLATYMDFFFENLYENALEDLYSTEDEIN